MKRAFFTSVLIGLLAACAADANPHSSNTGPGGKADSVDGEACLFGDTADELYDVIEAGDLEIIAQEVLDEPGQFSRSLEAELLAGAPPSIDSAEDFFAWIDDGGVSLTELYEPEEAWEFMMFVYQVDGEEGGFIYDRTDRTVAAHLDDSDIVECNVVVELGSACYFGDYLNATLNDDRFDHTGTEPLGEELTDLEYSQIVRIVPTGSDVSQFLAEEDIARITLFGEEGNYYIYIFVLEDIEYAFFFEADSTELLASTIEGDFQECVAAPAPSSACIFGDTIEEFLQATLRGDFEYQPDREVETDDELTSLERRQLFSLVPVGGSLDFIFGDQDSARVLEIGETTLPDGSSFTTFSYDGEDESQNAYLFVPETTDLAGAYEDGSVVECNVE